MRARVLAAAMATAALAALAPAPPAQAADPVATASIAITTEAVNGTQYKDAVIEAYASVASLWGHVHCSFEVVDPAADPTKVMDTATGFDCRLVDKTTGEVEVNLEASSYGWAEQHSGGNLTFNPTHDYQVCIQGEHRIGGTYWKTPLFCEDLA